MVKPNEIALDKPSFTADFDSDKVMENDYFNLVRFLIELLKGQGIYG
jgi:23S rRNA G2069 N7-methylase RlmK/C1962 C5-methylase RlmI